MDWKECKRKDSFCYNILPFCLCHCLSLSYWLSQKKGEVTGYTFDFFPRLLVHWPPFVSVSPCSLHFLIFNPTVYSFNPSFLTLCPSFDSYKSINHFPFYLTTVSVAELPTAMCKVEKTEMEHQREQDTAFTYLANLIKRGDWIIMYYFIWLVHFKAAN